MKRLVAVLVALLSLAACGSNENGAATQTVVASKESKKIARSSNFETVQKGFRVYQNNCASCHGSEGQGAANWQQVGADGKYPPPPLNGTGHAWHHPMAALVRTIKYGTVTMGGKMPAWGDKITDEEISAVISWFQSRWPDELYQAWARMDQQAQSK